MIFVSVGTHPQPFTRLLREVSELVNQKKIKEEVIVQSGNTPFAFVQENTKASERAHANLKIIPFMDIEDFEKTLSTARLFITHAGEGNIGTALRMGIPMIIVPRLQANGEHTNDHQLELANAIASRGDALVADSILNWKELEKEAFSRRPTKESGHVAQALGAFARERGIMMKGIPSKKSAIPRTASIVVATLNGGQPLVNAVNGMLNQKFDGKYEVIVVDDGSYDGVTPQLLKKNFGNKKQVSLIFLPRSGVCKARNAGIRAAKYEVVINMDHDDNPEPEWLQIMVNGFDSPQVGAVSAYGHYGGTSTGFRKDLLDMVGGYDEDFFYYREDTDLSFRIMELGFAYKKVDGAKWHGDRTLVTPRGVGRIFAYTIQRFKYHMNDVLLHKKHAKSKLCNDFLHVKWNVIVNPVEDFKVATGLWGGRKEFELSSPRGMTFLPNTSPLHFGAIVLAGMGYAFAIKWARLAGSIKYGHLLV